MRTGPLPTSQLRGPYLDGQTSTDRNATVFESNEQKWTQLSHGYSILQFYIQNKEVSSLNFQLDKLEFDTKDNERGDNAGETLRTHENIYGFYFLDTQNEFNQITGEVTTRTNYTSEVF